MKKIILFLVICFLFTSVVFAADVVYIVKNNAFVGSGRLDVANSTMGWYDFSSSNVSDQVTDYNFVSGVSPSFASKTTFSETHGVNGGNPQFTDISDYLGADNLPFTLDDGLKPGPTSVFCGVGVNGQDIGPYSCSLYAVFSSTDVTDPTITSVSSDKNHSTYTPPEIIYG